MVWYGMVWSYGTVQSLCECHEGPRRGYLGSAHAVGSGDWRPARWCPACLGPRVALDEVENLFDTHWARPPGKTDKTQEGGADSASK